MDEVIAFKEIKFVMEPFQAIRNDAENEFHQLDPSVEKMARLADLDAVAMPRDVISKPSETMSRLKQQKCIGDE